VRVVSGFGCASIAGEFGGVVVSLGGGFGRDFVGIDVGFAG